MSATSTTQPTIRTGTYDVDPVHSRVGFAVRHLGINVVRGRFTRFAATIEVPEDLEDMRIEGSIEAGSVYTAFAQRDEHLRTGDFFDVENSPHILFAATGLKAAYEHRSQIAGEITIRRVTRPVTLDVEVGGAAIDQYDNERLGLRAAGHLSRADFGMPFNQAVGGVALVADRIDLSLDIEALRRPDGD